MIALFWRDHRKLVGLFLAVVLAVLALLIPTVAYMDEPTAIQGQVRDAGSGVVVADALIEIPALGLSTRSNSRGEFSWSGLSISGDYQAVTVQIQAVGYGNWTLENVRILRAETLILEAELKDTPQTITVPPPSNERPMGFAAAAEMAPMLFAMGGAEDIPIPETIRVRVTGNPYCNLSLPYTVEVIDFKDYVKHVLPNEWISSWPWESLRSGAMAAKMYAWYWVAAGGKWSDADVYDSTCDQVYNPAVSYASTNQAVDDTWNWRLTRDDLLIQTQYRAFVYQCGSADCMGQWDSRDLALGGWTWDEILFYFYEGTALTQVWNPPGGYSLRFDGIYNDTENRVLIPVDDPATADPGPPVDVGGEDFTIEFWIKASPGENSAPVASCGPNTAWQQGNLLFDRDRNGADRDYGLSLADGRVVFGVSGDGSGDLSLCAGTDLADNGWHHVAAQRRLSDGYLWLYIDGVLETEGDGPDGDISYPDDAVPPDTCGASGTSSCTPYDPMLAIGAEKHRMDSSSPSFNGWLDEIRFSNVLRYSSTFSPPADPFVTDADTVALYKLNEGYGNFIHDTSGASGGPSDGTRIYGGAINGPEWSLDTVWYVPPPTPTPTSTPTPTPTPAPTSVTFAVIGDYGTTSAAAAEVGALVASWNPDLVITTGDNNYPDGAASTIDDNIGQYYSEFIYPYTGSYTSSATENRFFPSLGNHDWHTVNAQPYLDYFTLQGNERYYDFVWGPVHFFALDSDVNEPEGISSTSTQAQWLQAALGASTVPWKVVYLHHAPFSSSDNHGSTTELQWPFETWGADAVLAGHDHTYERLTVSGIPYFVNGLGGMSIYDFGTPIAGSEVRYNGDYGAMLVVADETDITYQFINRSGQVMDTYSRTKTAISPIFDDVPTDHWAFDYINALFNAGYVAGCSAEPRLYCPDNILSRAESAVFVLRGQHGTIPEPPYPSPSTPTFADVDPAFWGFGWIESLWTDGFTAGCGTDPLIYCPGSQHTRAEGSVFFLRVKNGVDYIPPTPTGIFTDVDLGAWYAGWVEAAYNEGILPECSQDPLQFCPQDQLDRAWAAYMMVQAKGGLPLP
ncbi:MAG: metallophosphoesterase [Anaerolineales bacterium]|nr:metallophosphoesterase [Anaerolineales bacterium]